MMLARLASPRRAAIARHAYRVTNPLLMRSTRMDAAQEHATARAQVKLADSASKLTDSAVQQTDSADRRSELAADRTVLAAERTYAAWVRTGLAALASGIGARALLEKIVPGWLVSITGTVLILFSAFCFAAAVWRQFTRVAPPCPDTRRIPAWMLIAVNGFLGLVSLVAPVGLWLR
jgi:putative membrane protein